MSPVGVTRLRAGVTADSYHGPPRADRAGRAGRAVRVSSPAVTARSASDDVATRFRALESAIAQATTDAQRLPIAVTPQEQANAASYVRQLAQLNLGVQLLAVDPDHPVLFRDPDPLSVPGQDPPVRSGIYDPDNISYIAIVNGATEYRITGTRGNSVDLSVQAISGFPGAGTTGNPTATLLRDQIAVGADGTYIIDVAAAPKPGNWLATVPDTSLISVREAFNDWSTAVPEQLQLEVVGRSGKPATKLSDRQLITAIDAATAAVAQQAPYWTGLWQSALFSLPANRLSAPAPTQGGLAGQLSSLSSFDLPAGQSLVVSVGKSNARYQGFEAADAFGQSLPYATHQSSLNATQAELGSDGRYTFVVAATDPGVANWIDTHGYTHGLLFLRWQELSGTLAESDYPMSQVVPLASLRDALPPDTPAVSPAQRTALLAQRNRDLAVRLRTSSNEAKDLLTGYLQQIAGAVGNRRLAAIYAGSSLVSQLE
jgi:hypothetical protein